MGIFGPGWGMRGTGFTGPGEAIFAPANRVRSLNRRPSRQRLVDMLFRARGSDPVESHLYFGGAVTLLTCADSHQPPNRFYGNWGRQKVRTNRTPNL
jgi:hypothetical protein